MIARRLVLAHVVAAVAGTAAFWWLVVPAAPLEAVANGICAAAIASFTEMTAIRFGW
jgi:hypothetical protein